MNVLHLIHRYYPYVGGSEKYFQVVGERLAHENHRVTVYTSDAWDLEHFWLRGRRTITTRAETHHGVCIQRFPVKHLPLTPWSFQGLRWAMAQAAGSRFDLTSALLSASRFVPFIPELDHALDTLDESFDLVHVANVAFDSILYGAYRLKRRKKIPLVVTPFIHLGEPNDGRIRKYYTLPSQMKILRAADAVIVQTNLERAELARHGLAYEKMFRVGVGIEPAELQGGDAQRFRAKYDIHTPIIFSTGTAAYDKGTFHLVQAMEKLWAHGRDATLVIAGPTTTPFEKFFAAQSARVKKNSRVLGFIPDGDYRDLLAAGDVFAMPSRTDSFGIVYLEAWFYAKPVIGARAGGVPEIIMDEENGFLVNFGDVDALVSRLAQLLDDHALARRFGEAGHENVLREWTWDKKFAQIKEIYTSVTQGRLGRSE